MHLANLSAIISTQGASQVVGVFEGDPSKLKDWDPLRNMYI